MKARLLIIAFLSGPISGLHAAPLGATWLTGDSGAKTATATLGPVGISMTNLTGASKGGADLSTSDYSGAPLSSTESIMNYGVGSNYTATFSFPVGGLLIYAQNWRGNGTGVVGNVTYTFNHPVEILSGFSTASTSGNTLIMPSTGFQNGILRFKEPVSTLTLSMNTGSTQGQIFSFGVVPDPTTGLVITGPLKPVTKKGTYVLTGTASATYGIQTVRITAGGKTFNATGTTTWSYPLKLAKAKHVKKKRTRVLIQAISNDNVASAAQTVVITRKFKKKK